jgi:predicted nucleotide-binding protein
MMPLDYPSEWKFDGFAYAIPNAAHREFVRLTELISEGAKNSKKVYEEFKWAFGNQSSSSTAAWAQTDMERAMQSMTSNAARYVGAFYAGIEVLRVDGVNVPSDIKLNKLLADHDIPLIISPPNLLLNEDDSASLNANADSDQEMKTEPTTPVSTALEVRMAMPSTREPKNESVHRKVFVVHGHDNEAKLEVARLLERLTLIPIILHEQPNRGRTIIEKFELVASDVTFAVILLTPDDVGAAKAEKKMSRLKQRARQNVVFEMGFFYAKLGRERVCPLLKGNTEQPSDVSGVVSLPMDTSGSWRTDLAKEMKAAGLPVDLNCL